MPQCFYWLIGTGDNNGIKTKNETGQCSYYGITQQFVFVHCKYRLEKKGMKIISVFCNRRVIDHVL